MSFFAVVMLVIVSCTEAPSFEMAGSVAEPEDASTQGSFGRAVSFDGRSVVVGAAWDRATGTQAGAAYVYEAGTDGEWTQSVKLIGSETEPYDEFGSGVGISDDVVVVGAPREDLGEQDEGAAYVFERGNEGAWSEATRLTASSPGLNDHFGTHVALENNRVLVAAPFFGATDLPAGFRGGAVYVFERSMDGQWDETAILMPKTLRPDIRNGLRFGFALDVDGSRALIGADPIQGDGQNPPGLAYVFDRSDAEGWSQAAVLNAPKGENENKFGTAVALHGDLAVVGAPGENDYAGGAHVFERQNDGQWLQTGHLVAPDSVMRGNFGYEVAASESTVVVFAMASGDESTPGHAYVYQRQADGWSLTERIRPSQHPDLASFDEGATMVGNRLLAAGRDSERAKRVFIFQR